MSSQHGEHKLFQMPSHRKYKALDLMERLQNKIRLGLP